MIAKFSFAKNRNYIRATDLFLYVDKKHKKYVSINFIFKKKIKTYPKIRTIYNDNINSKLQKKTDAIGTVFFNKDKISYLFSNSKKKIVSTYEFKEHILERFFKLERRKKSIFFRNKSNLKAIEILVSLNKKLNEKLFPSKKKWIVSRISLNQKFSNSINKNLKVKIISLKHKTYTISALYDNNVLKGYLYFNLI